MTESIYKEYQNKYYNPNDNDKKPGDNDNWKSIQEGFYRIGSTQLETSEGLTVGVGGDNEETLSADELKHIKTALENIPEDYQDLVDDVTDLKSQIDDLDGYFQTTEYKSDNMLNPDNINAGYYWTDGWHSSTSYVNTGLIPVEAGKTYSLQKGHSYQAANRSLDSPRFVVYLAADQTTSVGSDSYISSLTVPDGGAYIVASVNISDGPDAYKAINPMFVEGTTVVDYEPYFAPYTETVLKAQNNNDSHIKDVITASRHIKNGLVAYFDIATDNHEIAEEVEDMFGYSIQFHGNITTFNGLTIAHGYQVASGGYLKITATKIESYLGTEAEPRLSEDHNLTFKDYIAVRIDAKPNHRADFTIYTNGGVYTKTNAVWDVRKGHLAVRSNGANTLTGCALSYNCEGWGKPTHLYGDSYFGTTSSKWTKYLVDAGFLGNLQNGYPGRTTNDAMPVLKTVIENSNPERIVWCMGMNDGSDDGAPSPIWKAGVDELEEICEERGIELILATIPNVATVDNTYKNAYVKASNHRYIDFAEAVGATSSTTWFEDMLSSDNVHPDVQGAIALFNRAIADVPELMQ